MTPEKVETILAIMPGTLETFLAAASAMQSLRREMPQANEFHYYVSKSFQSLWSMLPGKVISGWPRPPIMRGQYDLVCTFDVARAYQLSIATERHMAQVFGLIIGSEAKPLPVIPDSIYTKPSPTPQECPISQPNAFKGHSTTEQQVLFLNNLPGSLIDEFKNELESGRYPCIYPALINCMEVEDLNRINQAKAVIGLRSGLTYLAAAMGKQVLEIYPGDFHPGWLHKWANPLYKMWYNEVPSLGELLSHLSGVEKQIV